MKIIFLDFIFTSAVNCDIRIQLISVSEEHCFITRNEEGQVKRQDS